MKAKSKSDSNVIMDKVKLIKFKIFYQIFFLSTFNRRQYVHKALVINYWLPIIYSK